MYPVIITRYLICWSKKHPLGMLLTWDDHMSHVYHENPVPCIFSWRGLSENMRCLYSYHCSNFTIVFGFNSLGAIGFIVIVKRLTNRVKK
jgi:hypothetical protein